MCWVVGYGAQWGARAAGSVGRDFQQHCGGHVRVDLLSLRVWKQLRPLKVLEMFWTSCSFG